MMKLRVEYETGTKEERDLIEVIDFFFKMKYAHDEEIVMDKNRCQQELDGEMELILEYHK